MGPTRRTTIAGVLLVVVCMSQAMTETPPPPAASILGLSVSAAVDGETANASVSVEDDEEAMAALSNEVVALGAAANAGRGVISDIAKLKKIGEILETVGETVIPALIESQTQRASLKSAIAGDAGQQAAAISKEPIGLKLLHALKQEGGFNEGSAAPL